MILTLVAAVTVCVNATAYGLFGSGVGGYKQPPYTQWGYNGGIGPYYGSFKPGGYGGYGGGYKPGWNYGGYYGGGAYRPSYHTDYKPGYYGGYEGGYYDQKPAYEGGYEVTGVSSLGGELGTTYGVPYKPSYYKTNWK